MANLLGMIARLLGPGGAKAIVAENLLLRQQLPVICRHRNRAPNLSPSDRFLLGFWSLFLRPVRLVRNAIAIRPSTLLRFHKYLVHRKYRELFTPKTRTKPGPKGPSVDLIRAIVEVCRQAHEREMAQLWTAEQDLELTGDRTARNDEAPVGLR